MTMDASARVLERYNAKVFKNRKEHMLKVNPAEDQIIIANTRAIPGIMTNRGCCYAGCKGVVLGPIKDMVTITHGPVGCGFYSWGTRRNKAKAEGDAPAKKTAAKKPAAKEPIVKYLMAASNALARLCIAMSV